MQTNRLIECLRRSTPDDGAGRTDGELLGAFVRDRDGAALAALVRRHGPMVWGVCIRILRGPQDAEDAFQATFLVLVQKAATLPDRETVGNWLHGVARQTAVRMRALAVKRGARERQVADMPEPTSADEYLWNDLKPVLDEELGRLPEKYRVLIVLCDLEGRTRTAAARQLAIPEGTVASRLAAARAMLARRLASRGVVVSGTLLGTVLASRATAARVPPAIVSNTLEAAAALVAAGHGAVGALSPTVVTLVTGVTRVMLVSKLKAVMACVLVAGLALGGVGLGAGLFRGSDAMAQPNPMATRTSPPATDGTPPVAGASDEMPPNSDLHKLQGTWVLQETRSDGKIVIDDKLGRIAHARLVIDGNWLTLREGTADRRFKHGVEIDEAAKPKRITFNWSEERAHGLYKLDGDTFQFCYEPGSKAPPTEFGAGPGSKNLLLVYKRQQPPAPGVKDAAKLTAELAKELLPPAAGISNADFEKLLKDPQTAVKSKSLSLVLLALPPPKNPDAARDKEFRFLGDAINPSDVARAMWISQDKGYASFIQPKSITECSCESTAERAEGVVTFKSDLFAGRIPFVARATKDGWIITEFRLPQYKTKVVRGNDGVWSQEALNGEPMDAQKDEEREKEAGTLDGEWVVVAWEEEGEKAPAADLKGKKLVIKGNEIAGQLGLTGKMSFKLDPGKTPREIDLTARDGTRKGTTEPGIYAIEGQRLRICYGGKVRPKEFATTPGSGLLMLTLEKEGGTGHRFAVSLAKAEPRPRTPRCAFLDNDRILVQTGTGTLEVRDAKTGEVLKGVNLEGRLAGDFRLSADRKSVAALAVAITDGSDGTLVITPPVVTVWDTVTWKVRGTVNGCRLLDVAEDGRTVLVREDGGRASGQTGQVEVWDIVEKKMLKSAPFELARIDAAAISPDGSLVAVSGVNEIVYWNWRDGDKFDRLKVGCKVDRLVFSPDGKFVAEGPDTRETVEVRDTKTLKVVKELSDLAQPRVPVAGMAFANSGRTLVFGNGLGLIKTPVPHRIHFWDVTSGKITRKIDLKGGAPYSLDVSPDGKTLAVVTADDGVSLQVFDLEQGDATPRRPAPPYW